MTDAILFWPAPFVGILMGWMMWRTGEKELRQERWKFAATGVIAGTLGWPAVIGMGYVALVTIGSIALEVLWLFLTLVTWTPGRG